MTPKILALFSIITLVSGCVASPRIEIPQKLTFDYVPEPIVQMSREDLMCCTMCKA